MSLSTYLPEDRWRALARGESLPDRTHGSVLFADISGFTSLTEALRESLGPRRGVEELTQHLDTVYTSLIAEVEGYGGSVIDFAGDAITCWFDGAQGPSAPRAAACALAIQQAMRAFAAIALPNSTTTALTLKVAVATGRARRFVVGDPDIQRVDVLAGTTIARAAAAEHLTSRGEVLLDEATISALGPSVTVREWRAAESGERFAVVTGYGAQPRLPVSFDPPLALNDSVVRTWIHPAVYERERAGQGAFLTEFRLCAALFVRFTGIPYEADEAEAQLDAFIRQVQAIAGRHQGTLLQITIGDKGSYLYISLGALNAHEDDARRAMATAMELRSAASQLRFLEPLQMGLAQGMMRVGAYGGPTRHTFGALSDDTNLAARLMQIAAPDETLVSGHVQKAALNNFVFEPRPPLPLKGKAEPIPIFAVIGERQHHAIRLQEPAYALPMVGRQSELQAIGSKLELALQGQAQVIAIVAEAGLGKSRLVAEAIHLARRKGFTGYGGACQSDGVHTPYLVWKAIWNAFFGVDPELPLRKQVHSLEVEITDRASDRLQALPLLGQLLNLNIPDNDFTKTLEPKDRRGALHALLEDCLKAAAHDEPLLIVLEDLHWMDSLSHELLEELALALPASTICFVLANRPPQLLRLQSPRFETLPVFTRIELSELTATECELAIRAKLAQLYPARAGVVPPALIERLVTRSEGNPFFLEELLNFLHDRGLDPRDPAALDKIELPDSLHTLILSRIDTLNEHEKTTLRAASIIGRLFRVTWLTGFYPALGGPLQVKADLEELSRLDITPLDTPEPELAYLFKHIVTHEATYESVSFSVRAQLHEQLAQYLESISAPVETIAHHYGQSHNESKQRKYFQKAGDAAETAYANEAALAYYAQLLPLLTEPLQQIDLLLKRGNVLALVGRYTEAEVDFQAALNLADRTQNARACVECQRSFSNLKRRQEDVAEASWWAEQALVSAETLADPILQAHAALDLGRAKMESGDNQPYVEKALSLARIHGDLETTANALRLLAVNYWSRSDYNSARPLFEESLALSRRISAKSVLVLTLNNYGNFLSIFFGELTNAQTCHVEALRLNREMGDKFSMANDLVCMAEVAMRQGSLTQSQVLAEQALTISHALRQNNGLVTLSHIRFLQGDYLSAQRGFEQHVALMRKSGVRRWLAGALSHLVELNLATQQLTVAQVFIRESLPLWEAMGSPNEPAKLLGLQGMVAVLQHKFAEAQRLGTEALAVIRQTGSPLYVAQTLCNVGFIACCQSNYSEAQAYYLESMKILLATEYRGFDWARAWGGAAVTFLRRPSTVVRGVQLAAFAEQVLSTMGAVLWPIERSPFDEVLESARAKIGEEAFVQAWEVGRSLTSEQALALAMENANG